MKHQVFFFLLVLPLCACGYRVAFSSPLKNNDSGKKGAIGFLKSDFANRIDSARAARRPVFVDFYTDWCSPCRVLDRDVFSDPRVAAYYNERFLNLKVNAEKGEGVALARQFGVKVYPTLVFLDASGAEKERVTGIVTAAGLKKTGRRVTGSR